MTIENLKLLFARSMFEKKTANSIRIFRKIFDYYNKENKIEEIYDLLWVIYYDFYAINNPKYQQYMDKKYLKWIKTKDISSLLCVIKNMIKRPSKANVFLLRKYNGGMTKLYIGRRPKKYDWLDNYEKKYHDLLRAINNKDYENIATLVHKIKNDEEIYLYFKAFLDYLKNVVSENKTLDTYGDGKDIIKIEVDKDFNSVLELIKKTNYKNKNHIFLACIIYSFTDEIEHNISEIYVGDNDKDKEIFHNPEDIDLIEQIEMLNVNKIEYFKKIFSGSIIPVEKCLKTEEDLFY